MGKSSTGLTSSVGLLPKRLALVTAMALLCIEMGAQRISLAQSETDTQDVPEEMLQTQITTEANSPLTGLTQTASNNAQEQKQLQVAAAEVPPRLAPNVYRALELLRLRKLLKSFLPFL